MRTRLAIIAVCSAPIALISADRPWYEFALAGAAAGMVIACICRILPGEPPPKRGYRSIPDAVIDWFRGD